MPSLFDLPVSTTGFRRGSVKEKQPSGRYWLPESLFWVGLPETGRCAQAARSSSARALCQTVMFPLGSCSDLDLHPCVTTLPAVPVIFDSGFPRIKRVPLNIVGSQCFLPRTCTAHFVGTY